MQITTGFLAVRIHGFVLIFRVYVFIIHGGSISPKMHQIHFFLRKEESIPTTMITITISTE